jgi:predicted CopG family antitoxin
VPRPRKYADVVVKSFSIEREVYARLKAVLAVQGKSISEEVNDLLKKRLAEFEGMQQKPLQGFVDYEALKRQHIRLSEETIRLTGALRKMGVYEELKELAQSLGLDFENLSNAEEIAAKLLKSWNGLKAHAHLFITLLETAKQKKEVERKLEEIRMHPQTSSLPSQATSA